MNYVKEAHKGPLGDMSFSAFAPRTLATVGDDRALRLWDFRAGTSAQQSLVVSEDEVLTVDWNRHCENWVATAGKDKEVRVWDLRSTAEPLHGLRGHSKDIL